MPQKNSSLKLLFGALLLSFLSCAQDSSDEEGDLSSGQDIFAGEVASPSDDSSDPLGREAILYCGTRDADNDTVANLAQGFAQFGSSPAQVQRSFENSLARETVEIPLVFHVISKGSSVDEGEVPDSMLALQVDVLNREYSGVRGGVDTPFRFRLAGINRVRRPEWFVLAPGSESELAAKQALKVGGAETLNVYTGLIDAEALGQKGGTVLGYASLPVFFGLIPTFDGVVMNFRALAGGSLERYNLGHVLVHEVGHWLGLLHTFQGECDPFLNDLVPDTPPEKVPSKGEFCPVNRDTCPDESGPDPINNHMTYTDDACRSQFTAGQVSFMRFNSIVFRLMQVP